MAPSYRPNSTYFVASVLLVVVLCLADALERVMVPMDLSTLQRKLFGDGSAVRSTSAGEADANDSYFVDEEEVGAHPLSGDYDDEHRNGDRSEHRNVDHEKIPEPHADPAAEAHQASCGKRGRFGLQFASSRMWFFPPAVIFLALPKTVEIMSSGK